MKLLLDTNVVSERRQRVPDPAVLDWIARQPAEAVHLSTVSLAEIDYGLARMAAGARHDSLLQWRNDTVEGLGVRLLPVDAAVATAWGRIRAKAERAGRVIPTMDAFLAATAEVHGLTLVTRNTRDFEAWGGPMLNPWRAPQP